MSNWLVLAVGCSHHKILIQKEATTVYFTTLPCHNRHIWPAVRHSLVASNDSCWMNWGQKRILKISWYHIYIVTKLNWTSLTLLLHHLITRCAKTNPVTTDSSLYIECPTLCSVLSHLQKYQINQNRIKKCYFTYLCHQEQVQDSILSVHNGWTWWGHRRAELLKNSGRAHWQFQYLNATMHYAEEEVCVSHLHMQIMWMWTKLMRRMPPVIAQVWSFSTMCHLIDLQGWQEIKDT